MTKRCQDQLFYDQRNMVMNYKVSKGLVRSCKEDIRKNHCRKGVVDDKDVRLAQILLCLENVSRSDTNKLAPECTAEMIDHRKMLMDDYRLSPELMHDCANDITTLCRGIEAGGKTLHCLMDHARPRMRKEKRISLACRKSLQVLVQEADPGEDWRVDPILRKACKPVVDRACQEVTGGNGRVMSCLMEKLGTADMSSDCEAAIMQIQYFISRDFKLDPQLYKACKYDAVMKCKATLQWADASEHQAEKDPAVLPCLYNYAYDPDIKPKLKPACEQQVRRVMRQRAVSVDLLPEIEDFCIDDLTNLCIGYTGKGEEISCLQKNIKDLSPKCKEAVTNFTETQSGHIELNVVVTSNCRDAIERLCSSELKSKKEDDDVLECLISHKNDPEIKGNVRCKAAIDHEQLISLRNYRFTRKFKNACKSYVLRYCPKAQTKIQVVTCLSEIVRNDTINRRKHTTFKECRQQLRSQLFQQKESIDLDPDLKAACKTDLQEYCLKVAHAESAALECLQTATGKLSDSCRKAIFVVRKQEFTDNGVDYHLISTCNGMIDLYCHNTDPTNIFECLKVHHDKPDSESCKVVIVNRMIEQNTDYRFNINLQKNCDMDIRKYCSNIIDIKKQFVQHPQSATIEAGHSVTLRCVPPQAAPPVELKWTRNGMPLDVKENALQLTNIGLQVLERIRNINLMSANARYHQNCFAAFFNPRALTGRKRGRPTSDDIDEQMSFVYSLVETDDDSQHSLDDIRNKLNITLDDRTVIRKLKEKYSDEVIITNRCDRQIIICFAKKCHDLLRDTWYINRHSDVRIEKLRIVQSAAIFIRNDIRSQLYETDVYPEPDSFLSTVQSDIPETLKTFLNAAIDGHNEPDRTESNLKKKTAIAHSIITAVRPRTYISPLLLGIGSLLHHKYASRYLIELLSGLGYSVAYNEVLMFQASVIASPQPALNSGFQQFAFDNADFNTKTLDGFNTFHVMGGIQCITPKLDEDKRDIVRLKNVPKAIVIGNFGHTPLKHFEKQKSTGLKEKTIQDHSTENQDSKPSIADCLWLYGKTEDFLNLKGWSGFMENATKKRNYLVSEVVYLPFINAPASDYDTIYTALRTAADKTETSSMTTCLVTFDQPLYAKAQEIMHSTSDPKLKNIVLRLGGFHLLMSFMGTIGFIMNGSGLKELWNCIYAANSIDKMLAGHSYARAVRAHILTNLALSQLIMNDIGLSLEEKLDIDDYLDSFKDKCQGEVEEMPRICCELPNKFDEILSRTKQNGPTAQLWVQYMEMTTLIKKFIEAERTGNWTLHLTVIKEMLPYFYASGHLNYAKWASLYLDDMNNLVNKMPSEEYLKFINGLFTIRRTDKFWAGVWSDMTIEQTLMRSMKCIGGLTHGRGLSDSVTSRWILSLPAIQKASEAVEDFCGFHARSSSQHVDSRDSRIKRDYADTEKIMNWLTAHEPFRQTDKLVSISKGLVGDDKVNCHKAYIVGKDIMKNYIGSNYSDVTFSRKNRICNFQAMTSTVKVENVKVPIESDVIMRRICFNKQSQEELRTYFEYELTPYPLSLFDDVGMRKTRKSSLYDLFKPLDMDLNNITDKMHVVDGGYLIHKVIWTKGTSFNDICQNYLNYVTKTFGSNTVIVFDGYENEDQNTKSAERGRRAMGNSYVDIMFERNTICTVPQDKLLANKKNKKRLIQMVSQTFVSAGIRIVQSDGDADTLIVSTAIELGVTNENVVIVGEDVDLLVILTTHTNPKVVLMKPGRGKVPTKIYNSESLLEPSLRDHILFIHAMSGCDTTSALFKIGKKKCATLLKKDINLRMASKIFTDPEADAESVAAASEQFLCKLYGGSSSNLNAIRYERFAQATIKTSFNMANLPPTKDSARQHSFRVYHQVQHWLNNHKDATKWGWRMQHEELVPIQTLNDAAPLQILKTISCKCKTTCGRNCTCKKCGMNCTDLCLSCVGKECYGSIRNDKDDAENSEDEDEENFFKMMENEDILED